jgi:hypothetical protein
VLIGFLFASCVKLLFNQICPKKEIDGSCNWKSSMGPASSTVGYRNSKRYHQNCKALSANSTTPLLPSQKNASPPKILSEFPCCFLILICAENESETVHCSNPITF